MLKLIAFRVAALVAIAASVAAFGFWLDGQAKARRITDLEARVLSETANAEAMATLAQGRSRVEVIYRDATAEVNPNEFSEQCLADPALLRAYAAIERMRDANADRPTE